MDDTTAIEWAVRRLSRGTHLTRLHRHLNALAGVTLDGPAYIALACLADEGPRPVSALAEANGVEVSTMSRLAERLGAAGLIETRQSALDQRVVILSLSPVGASLVEQLRQVRHTALQQVLADWMSEEQALFARAGIETLAPPVTPLRRSEAAPTLTGETAGPLPARPSAASR